MPSERYRPVPVVDTAGLNRDEWLEYRKHGFGASDMPVVMEQSKYKSVLALFLEKVSRRPIDELDKMVAERKAREAKEGPPSPPMFGTQPLIIAPDSEFNLPAECGNALEPVIGKFLSTKLGVPVYKDTVMYRHPHHPFLFVDLDYMAILPDIGTGEINRHVIVECKTITSWKEKDVSFAPLHHHVIQCRAEMAVMNINEVILIYLCDNNEGSVYAYRIYRDYGKEAELIQRAKNLWKNHVMKEILPIPAVSTEAAWHEIAEHVNSGRRFEIPREFSEERLAELSRRYCELKQAVEAQGGPSGDTVTALEEIKLQLAPYLFSEKETVCGDLTLKWKHRMSRSMDYEGFKLAHPLLYAQFVTEKKSTWLDVKVNKGSLSDFMEEAA
jgi:predicted phage-related endonuclease